MPRDVYITSPDIVVKGVSYSWMKNHAIDSHANMRALRLDLFFDEIVQARTRCKKEQCSIFMYVLNFSKVLVLIRWANVFGFRHHEYMMLVEINII